ncbi:MAG: cobalamin biosynthesis protein P47K [Verrucomicrobiae bacterium]|nr:cobalamin biosynthesis protein P47K [Verrucomicrobiae bacterium]
MKTNPTSKARYIMIGGFLGAGKTTSVARLAERLTSAGRRVGLITNDQGSELVDTAMLRSKGFATEEISGGCFCCRFNSLVDAANHLAADTRPEVFIAEPVGSCTDLVATVTYPLRRMYGEQYQIAPLSVLVDPVRARRVLGLESGGNFSEKVRYIYRKQLEEADFIVINKADLLDPDQRAELRAALIAEFAPEQIFEVSARTGSGLDEWFSAVVDAEQVARKVMAVDYDVYADGEALLGWLNATVNLGTDTPFNAAELMRAMAENVQGHLNEQTAEIAHFKMTLSPDDGFAETAVMNLVRNDFIPELSQELDEPVTSGQLIINLRAEADPSVLAESIEQAVANLPRQFPGLTTKIDHLEHFKPGRPTPTHRLEKA